MGLSNFYETQINTNSIIAQGFSLKQTSFQYGVDYNSNPFKILYNRLHFQQFIGANFLNFL